MTTGGKRLGMQDDERAVNEQRGQEGKSPDTQRIIQMKKVRMRRKKKLKRVLLSPLTLAHSSSYRVDPPHCRAPQDWPLWGCLALGPRGGPHSQGCDGGRGTWGPGRGPREVGGLGGDKKVKTEDIC